jgi:uncharacterized protein
VDDPTDAQLEQLLDLQRTDHHVRKLEHQLDALPEQRALETAEARVAELTARIEDLAERYRKTESEGDTLSRDIDTLAARRDAERVRLYDGSVTNQREMSSVEAEIESTDRRISEHEDDLLVILERCEELDGRRTAATEERTAAEAAVAEAETARDTAAASLLADLGESKVQRDRQAAELPPELLTRYEAAAERGGGTGVGELDQGSCTACRLDFSMVEVDDLYRGPPLTSCPHCRRLLVVGRG